MSWGDDRGSATVEFVGLAVLVLTPLIYLALTVFTAQQDVFATVQAARNAGRALELAPSWDAGVQRAVTSARLAYQDHGLQSDDLTIRLADPGQDCVSHGTDLETSPPRILSDGMSVCVARPLSLLAVPSFLDPGRNTTVASYTLHVSPYAEGSL